MDKLNQEKRNAIVADIKARLTKILNNEHQTLVGREVDAKTATEIVGWAVGEAYAYHVRSLSPPPALFITMGRTSGMALPDIDLDEEE